MSAPGVILGIDVGTSGCKSILLSPRGRVLASATASYSTRRGLDGEVTQDARDWLVAVRRTIRAALAAAAEPRVAAMAVTAPAHYAVLCDRGGAPLDRVLLSSDSRPAAVAAELARRLGPRAFEVTGERLTAGWTFAQLVWIRRARPDLWPKLHRVLVVKDYVRFELTGEAVTDPSDAAGTALFDQARGSWSPELLAEAGLDPEMLPPIAASTALGGRLGRTWARRLGLPAGTPVAVGATDTAAELVSVGALEPGDGIVKIASTGTVVAVTDRLVPHPALLAYPHAVPDRWYSAAATNTAATAFSWLRSTLFSEDSPSFPIAYRRMDQMARRVPPGAHGLLFLPFLEGERSPYWDPKLRAAFVGLSASHSRDHVCRAVLEGVALSLRTCRETMEEAGIHVARPVLAGGGMASTVWRSILASVLGVEAAIAEPQGPAIGAALLAAAAVGVAPARGGRPVARPRLTPVDPEPTWLPVYDRLFDAYREAVAASVATSHRLAELTPSAAPSE